MVLFQPSGWVFFSWCMVLVSAIRFVLLFIVHGPISAIRRGWFVLLFIVHGPISAIRRGCDVYLTQLILLPGIPPPLGRNLSLGWFFLWFMESFHHAIHVLMEHLMSGTFGASVCWVVSGSNPPEFNKFQSVCFLYDMKCCSQVFPFQFISWQCCTGENAFVVTINSASSNRDS